MSLKTFMQLVTISKTFINTVLLWSPCQPPHIPPLPDKYSVPPWTPVRTREWDHVHLLVWLFTLTMIPRALFHSKGQSSILKTEE